MDFVTMFDRSFRLWLGGVAEQDKTAGRTPMRFSHAHGPTGIKAAEPGRYIVVWADMGLDNDRLIKELSEAVLYQIIPWDCQGQKPQVHLSGAYVAVEIPLPVEAQKTSVTLSSLTNLSHGGQVIVLGPNEVGVTISLPLADVVHVLIGGATGSGKTYTMRTLAYQLAAGGNRIVLIDGKMGEGLGVLNGLPGQVGPLAVDTFGTINALGWVYSEMVARYETVHARGGQVWTMHDGQPIIVLFDEFQAYRNNRDVMALVNRLVAQGRAAGIHMVAGTQRPAVRMFGPDGGTTRDQFGLRIAHQVPEYKASEAIIGGNSPRADYLLGAGDAYIVGGAGTVPVCERVQIAYVAEAELLAYVRQYGGKPELPKWPTFDLGAIDGATEPVGRPAVTFDSTHLGAAVWAAQNGWGRPRLQRLLDQLDAPLAGSGPVDRLLEQGREIVGTMERISCLPV